MRRALHLHAWGPEDGEPLVCLHGVTGWGGHFAELAGRALPGHRVLAPDLLGHGRSPHAPPWSITAQLEAVLETVGEAPRRWLGHSFGGRLAWELAAARPDLVDDLVLLDPAIVRGRAEALLAFAEDARARRAYASFAELVDSRLVESQLTRAPRSLVADELLDHVVEVSTGRWEYRYAQAATVAAYGELATEPAAATAVGARTLLVVGAASYLPLEELASELRSALGHGLEIVTVPGGHTVLWEALPETAAAVASFLAGPGA